MTATALDWAEYAARDFEPRKEARRWATPGQLAAVIDPSTVQTPALDLIDEAVVWAYGTRGARLVVSMPPQEGKSSRVTKTGALWALIRNPALRIGITSYAQSLADGFGRDIRNWITSFSGDEGTLDLGLKIAPDYGSARRWQLAGHRGGVVCAGIGSGLTGKPLDALVIDDPFADKEQADSEVYRARVWGWWQSVGGPRLAPGAPAIVICTRWHEDDLVGRLLKAEDGHRWRVINIPALADHKPEKGETDPLGRAPGEWLTSARRRTVADWEQIRIQAGSRVFAALYQGRPSPDQGNVWLRQWWRRYHEPLWSQHPTIPGAYLVHGCDEVVMSWDMAFKDTKSSDFVVGQVWARRGPDVFLLDQVHKRLSFTGTLTAFLALVNRWPQATRKLVEDKANGTAVLSSLKSKISGIVGVTPTESKYARASAVAPFIEAGNAFLPGPEIALFDAEALVDECVVGSTMILTRLGLVPASEIKPGSEVLTHRGRFRRVTAVSRREAPELVTITAKTLDPLTLTPDHPVYAMAVRRNSAGLHAPVDKDWVPAGELSCRAVTVSARGEIEPSHKPHHAMTFPVLDGDYEVQEIDLRAWFDMSFPGMATNGRSFAIKDDSETISINTGRAQPLRYRQKLDHRFGRVCGLYLAEGSYSKGRAYWSLHKDETNLAEEITSYLRDCWGINGYVAALGKACPNGINVTASLRRLERFFEEFGRGAPNKRIPWWAWEAPVPFIEGLVSGWFDGDGCKKENAWVGTTVSPHLAWGIRALATRLNKWVLIRHQDPRRPSTIRGRAITPRYGQFTVTLLDSETTTHVFDGEHIGIWIKETAPAGCGTVYNFTVDEDESYVTTGGTVHNCAGFPNATHDDQVDATSQALAELLLDGNGAMAWIAWAKRKAEEAAAGSPDDVADGSPPATAPPGPAHEAGTAEPRSVVPTRANGESPMLVATGAPADPVTARQRARDAAFREQRQRW